MIKKIKFFLIEWIGFFIIWLLGHTIRWEEYGYDNVKEEIKKGCILPFWHNRILMVSYFMRGRKTAALISKHRDGEIIARVASHFGHQPIRGSTGKGGKEAIPVMIEKIRKGYIMGITPDGPLGPKYKLQAGTIKLAEETQKPIIPIIIGVRDKYELRSWDNFIIPKPFTKAKVIWGGPFYIKKTSDTYSFEKERQRIEKEMMKLVNEADNFK